MAARDSTPHKVRATRGVAVDRGTDEGRLCERAEADAAAEGYSLRCRLGGDDWWLFRCAYVARFMAGYRAAVGRSRDRSLGWWISVTLFCAARCTPIYIHSRYRSLPGIR